MATTKLFYIGTELASAPPFLRRFFIDDLGKRCYVSLGTAAASDWAEIQMTQKTAQVLTDSQILTGDDNGKILVFSGSSLVVTLPDTTSLPVGWRTTLVNENAFISQTDSATAHLSSVSNKPVGVRNILVSLTGTDSLDGASTELLGFALVIPPRTCVDIWATGSGRFSASVSSKVGWRNLSLIPTTSTSTKTPTNALISSSFIRSLRFTRQDTGVEREVFFTMQIPSDYLPGSSVYPNVFWTPGDNTLLKTVSWGWEYCVTKGYAQQALTPTGTSVVANTTMGSTPYMFYTTEVSDSGAISPTSLEPDALIHFRMFRNSGTLVPTPDDFSGSAYVQTVGLHYLSISGGTSLKAPPFYL